jgi:hypothetical protein
LLLKNNNNQTLSSHTTLLGKEYCVDVGKDTASRNGHSSEQLVQFFVILDGKRNVTRDDAALLVVTRSIARQFQNLGTEIFEHSGQIHGSTRTHARRVLAIAQVATDASHGELKTSLGGCRGRLFFAATSLSFSFARHDEMLMFLIDDDET